MKLIKATATALLLALVATAGMAQNLKLGYTNIEFILANMPEARQVQQELQTYERKLQEQYNVKLSYAQSKQEEYSQKKQQGKLTPDQEKAAIDELKKLEEEIKAFAEESQKGMEKKREELLSPVVAKMQKAIDEVAKEEAYTYVFNSNAAGGVSVLLHAPQQDNITEKVLKKLGVTMPAKDQPAPGAQPTGGAPK